MPLFGKLAEIEILLLGQEIVRHEFAEYRMTNLLFQPCALLLSSFTYFSIANKSINQDQAEPDFLRNILGALAPASLPIFELVEGPPALAVLLPFCFFASASSIRAFASWFVESL